MPDLLRDWLALLDTLHPEADAEGWDAVGLHVGDPTDPVTGVHVSLDVTPAVLEETAAAGADLLIAHHPLLFRPLERLTPGTAAGRLALQAARAGIAVAAAHTNVDVAQDGTCQPSVDALGLRDVQPLRPQPPAPQVMFVTTVPDERARALREALIDAGALRADSRPDRPSDRVEAVMPQARLSAAVDALGAVHPSGGAPWHAYALAGLPEDAKGLGRIGTLPEPLALGDVAERLAVALPAPGLRVAGDLDRPVRRVAVCGGAGESLIGDARAAGADVLVTGDLKHHVALDALTMGLALVDAGHFATENPAMDLLTWGLQTMATQRGLVAPVTRSRVRTDPWADWRPPPTT